jgi:hypothetical protein
MKDNFEEITVPKANAHRRILRILPYAVAAVFYLSVVVWVTVHTTALDYGAYLIGAHGFITGQDVYQWQATDFRAAAQQLNIPYFAYPYRYSPVTALMIAPLLAFPYRAGLFIWSLINAVAILATGELLSRLSANPAKCWFIRFAIWLFVPFLVSVYAGQVNPLVTLLAALAVLAFGKGRDREAGSWTALAFLIKPTVIGLIGYSIWKGRWKMAITFAPIAGVLLALMTAFFGWGSLQSGVPLSIAGIRAGAYPPLQNFWGAAQRWFTAHEYGRPLANNPALSDQAALLLSLGLAIATIVFCRPPFHRNSWRHADLGMVIIAVALMVPATWYHHYAILAIPMAILIASSETRMDIALVLVAWLAIDLFGVAWHDLVGHTLLLDTGTLGALILWLGLARISKRQRAALIPRLPA